MRFLTGTDSTSSLLERRSLDSSPQTISHGQLQMDSIIAGFSREAGNWQNLAAMAVGGLTFRFARVASLETLPLTSRLFQSLPSLTQGLSASFALASEVTAFRASSYFFSSISGHLITPEQEVFHSKGWCSSFIDFALLKSGGHFARGLNPIFAHTLQDAAMVAGHNLSYALGFALRPEGSLLDQFMHAEITNLQLEAGMALAGRLTSFRLQVYERSLDARLESIQNRSLRRPTSLRSQLQIEMASENRAQTFDLSPYQEILEHGIRNEGDLELARRLFKELDPEDLGKLAEASHSIPHRFKTFQRGSTGGKTLGATRLSFSQGLDRKARTVAQEILLANPEAEKGVALPVLPHEWKHATELTSEEKAQVPDMILEASLVTIYRSILDSRYWDEAFSFATGARFAKKFEERTGKNLYSFGIHQSIKDSQASLQEAYERGGTPEIFHWVSRNRAYLPYKVAALYTAILVKKGMRDFPSWENILQSIGAEQKEGNWVLSPAALGNFYNTHLKSFLAGHARDAFFMTLGMSAGKHLLLLDRTLRYFTGAMSPLEASEFLEREFDPVVETLGALAFNDRLEDALHKAQAVSRVEEVDRLSILDTKAMRNEDALERSQYPAKLADKIEIAGRLTQSLREMANVSDASVIEHWESYLTYAEQTDPASASNVYARMRALVRQRNFGAQESTLPFALRWSLGLSLLRSGYHDTGLAYCREAIGLMNNLETAKASVRRTQFKRPDLKEIIRLGHPEVVEEFFDRCVALCETELANFERSAVNPPDNFRLDYGIYRILIPVLSELTKGVKEEEVASYPPSLNAKLHGLIERAWAPLKQGMNAKIEKYRQRYAPDRREITSIDELSILNLREGRREEDSTLLVGARYGNYDSSPVLLERCLRSPLTYRMGLRLLAEFPQSFQKVELYEIASEYIPKNLTDREREDFAEAYRQALHNQEQALLAWKLIEDSHDRNTQMFQERNKISFPADAAQRSHFFWKHTRNIARVYAKSGNPAHQARAQRILRDELSDDTNPAPNIFNENWYYTHFQAALWKARALAHEASSFPVAEREGVLREAFHLARACVSEGLLANHKGRVVLIIAEAAAKENLGNLLEEIHRAWVEEIQEELSFAQEKVPANKENVKRQWDEVAQRASSLFPLWRSLADTSRFAEMVARVEEDARSGRRIFFGPTLTDILWLLSTESVSQRFDVAEREDLFPRFAIAAMDHQIQSAGKEDLSISYLWDPLVKAVRELPVSMAAKDHILYHLVEAVTPEAGSQTSGKNLPIERIADGYQIVEFAIGNPETPQTDAALLDRFASSLREVDFNRSDPRSVGALRGTVWVFERVAHRGILHPSFKSQNASLRDTPYYRRTQESLNLFQSPHLWDKQSISEAERVRYAEVLTQGDPEAIRHLQDKLDTAIVQEFVLFMDGRKDSSDKPPSALELQGTLLGKTYRAWRQAFTTGDTERANLLFPLWVKAHDLAEAQHKRRLYYEVLDDEGIVVETKRAIYGEIAKTPLASAYEKYVWNHPLIVGNPYREPLFYHAVVPPIRHDGFIEKRGGKLHYSYLLHPITSFALIANYYERVRRLRRMHAEAYEWKMDPLNPGDWELYTVWQQHNWYEAYAALNATMLFRAHAPEAAERMFEAVKALPEFDYRSDKPLRTQMLDAADQALISQKLAEVHIRTPQNLEYALARTFWCWESLPSREEAEASLGRIKDIRYDKDKRSDEANAALFEIPELFRKRDSLTQFLLSRFFMEMDIGEQHTLRKALKGISEEQALRVVLEKMGLEKIGQFLSFWPEVPPDLRKELGHFQNEIEPSDFEEVKETIRAQLGPGPETEAILHNMEEMQRRGEKVLLGSGSIGETYRSRLSNGEEVVVKVITPSKERKFKTALRRIQKVEYLLWLYDAEWHSIPGAREAFRLIKMYQQMVEKEFDLRLEAANATEMAQDLPAGIAIPRYIEGLIREKVAIQSFAKGVKLAELQDSSLRSTAVTRLRNHLIQDQVLKRRKYHSDLQPGNILVEKESGTVWLLDFGQVGELTEQEIEFMRGVWSSFYSGNLEILPSFLEGMSESVTNYDREGLRADLHHLQASWDGNIESLSPLVSQIFRASQQRGLHITLPYLQLLKGFATFEASANSENFQ